MPKPDATFSASLPPPVVPANPQCDKAMALLIRGVSLLIAQARHSGMNNAVRILSMAKEDLVYWAVNLNFHETAKEQFINQQLYGHTRDAGSELLHYIQQVEGEPERAQLLKEFEQLLEHAAELSTKPGATKLGDGRRAKR